ncbi:hypothetical protein Q0Z83_042490 [Actinoplanes sichuanensis]|nr:hypothetical protein Q0Z83_042490 [Actinoplanes sichuanensis]
MMIPLGAFARLADHVAPRVCGLIRRVLPDPAQADEVAQRRRVDHRDTDERVEPDPGRLPALDVDVPLTGLNQQAEAPRRCPPTPGPSVDWTVHCSAEMRKAFDGDSPRSGFAAGISPRDEDGPGGHTQAGT